MADECADKVLLDTALYSVVLGISWGVSGHVALRRGRATVSCPQGMMVAFYFSFLHTLPSPFLWLQGSSFPLRMNMGATSCFS